MSSFSTEMPSLPPARRRSLRSFAAAMVATIVALTAGTLLLPVDPYVRFQSLEGTIFSRARWIYERIHFDPTPIDVVFIGSSRTAAAVYPSLLEPALAARGLNLRVANFSLPASGFDIRETIAEELFSEKTPKLLVFSVVEAFPRDGHQAFGDIAPAGEIARAPWLVNRTLPGNLLRLPVRQIGLSLATLLPDAFGRHRDFNPAAYDGTTLDPRSMLEFDDDLSELETPTHAEQLAVEAKVRRREITPPILPESLAWIEFGVSRSYIERIQSLAEAHGARVAFLFLPFYTGPEAPLEKDWLERRGPLWNAAFIRDDPRNYVNSGHTSALPQLKASLTDWIADNITTVLADSGSAKGN